MGKNKTGLHIFIAEDEELISKLYRLQIESAGNTVTIAEDGYKAVEMMQALDKKPDLLLDMLYGNVLVQITAGSLTGEFGRDEQA